MRCEHLSNRMPQSWRRESPDVAGLEWLTSADRRRDTGGRHAAVARRRRRASAAVPWLAIAAVVVALATLLPLGFIVWVAVADRLATAVARWSFRPRVGELLVNTVLLVLLHGAAVRSCWRSRWPG